MTLGIFLMLTTLGVVASESSNLLNQEPEKSNENANQLFPHPSRCKEERLVGKDVNDWPLNRCIKELWRAFEE